jgi:hypothetical protein
MESIWTRSGLNWRAAAYRKGSCIVAMPRGLPWKDDTFHLVTQFTMFTSVLNAVESRSSPQRCCEFSSRQGQFVWYDF